MSWLPLGGLGSGLWPLVRRWCGVVRWLARLRDLFVLWLLLGREEGRWAWLWLWPGPGSLMWLALAWGG